MVFIKDPKKEFLEQIINKRVLVFVNLDVDALCAWKILQHLLHCEHVLYTVIPIETKQALEDSYKQHRNVSSHVVLINCGATLDLVDVLEPSDEAVFYVIDSQRPLEVRNVYNGVQVKIVVMASELAAEEKLVPEFEEIFDESEGGGDDQDDDVENKENEDDEDDGDEGVDDDDVDEDEADEEASSSSSSSRRLTAAKLRKSRSKRKRFDEEYLEKIHKKREWEQKRTKILFDYYKYAYHRCSASVVLFDLAWKAAKDNNDLLWWSLIGLTDQFVNAKIDRETYERKVVDIHPHVLRHNHRPAAAAAGATTGAVGAAPANNSSSGSSEDLMSVNALKIVQIDDLNMVLLRHWTILESINHSIDLACLFKMWTSKGKKKLNEFLADLGLPLNECKQKYVFMDSSHKVDFHRNIIDANMKEKYKYDESIMSLRTYMASFGFCNKFTAFDMAYAIGALIENSDPNKSLSDRFIEAFNALNRENQKMIEIGLDMARSHVSRIFQQLQNFIDMNQVVASGPFLQIVLEEGCHERRFFSQFLTSKRLARYVLQSYLSLTKGKKVRSMPLITCVPLTESTSLITGIPPYRQNNNTENCFGLAFDEAAEKTKSRVHFKYFDTSTIEINNEDMSKFLDALVAVMQ